VVALLLVDKSPETIVTLVESDTRKATFLRAIARETGGAFHVQAKRIEATEPLAASTLSARALAPLAQLLTFADQHLAPGGIALFPKGAMHQAEVETARKTWSFRCETIPSMTDTEAAILKIGEIERV
jgi:16S rRNA (guanine527-N7)-methyltransferase